MKILLAEDERSIRLTLSDDLEDAGHKVETAADGTEALKAIERDRFDVVISDIRMPGMTGTQLLRAVKEKWPDTEVIMITGAPNYELAVECMKEGAFDFIPKPFNHEEVIGRLRKLEEVIALRSENRQLRNQRDRIVKFDNLVGSSSRMQEIFEEIQTVASSDIPILLKGESGSGKELFAKAIHANSQREDKPMVTVACHIANENLLQSDLFGHVKGAYTGADSDREGAFVKADGGSIFLDDVDDMPIAAQATLLRAIQFGEITPLGWKDASKPLKVDTRVIVATKVELRDLIDEGQFREDLYYRVSALEIEIPPLRQRLEDIPHLVHHFISLHGAGEDYEVSDDAMLALKGYHWPGNIRELQSAVRAAIALSGKGRVLRKEHFQRSFRVGKKDFHDTDDMTGAPIVTLSEAVGAAERQHITRVLKHTEGNTTAAAQLLGISRKNLWEKRKKYGIDT